MLIWPFSIWWSSATSSFTLLIIWSTYLLCAFVISSSNSYILSTISQWLLASSSFGVSVRFGCTKTS